MEGARLWTWDDIMHLPEAEQPEIVGGKPFYRATPRMRHGVTVQALAGTLHPMRDRALAERGWWIAVEPCIRLSLHAIVGPDLAGWRKSRLPEVPDDWPLDVVPDWVCEVLSPTNAGYDRGLKADAYAAAGIPWYWLVDPTEQLVEVWQLVLGRWQVYGRFAATEHLALPPFGELPIAIAELFAQGAAQK